MIISKSIYAVNDALMNLLVKIILRSLYDETYLLSLTLAFLISIHRVCLFIVPYSFIFIGIFAFKIVFMSNITLYLSLAHVTGVTIGA